MIRIIEGVENLHQNSNFIRPWNTHLNIDLDYNIKDINTNESITVITIPKGTIYCTLGFFIKDVFKSLPRNKININREFNFIAQLFLVALKDRKLKGDQTDMVEEVFSNHQAAGHLYWITLELFKSVSRMASRIRLDVPDIIRHEYWTWQCFFMREIQDKSNFQSKKQFISHIRKLSRAIRNGENPFTKDDPEMQIFIDYAFSLSAPHQSNKHEHNDIRTLRKHIRERLKDLHKALSAYATYLERNPFKLSREEYGSFYEVGINGHMKRLKNYVEPL
jgi:hypothetical protein